MMRTLAKMIETVKIHVRGAENLTWKPADYENALAEAARRMWRHLLDTPAKRCLRAFDVLEMDESGFVPLPADCLRVERVEAVNEQDGRRFELRYELPDKIMRLSPFCGLLPCWTDDGMERTIHIMGAYGFSIRVEYFQEPVFPFVPSGTLRAPDGAATDTYPGIPELADSACEHFAAALLLGEETSDDKPLSYHGNQYSALMRTMINSMAVKPSRTYVRHAGKRW